MEQAPRNPAKRVRESIELYTVKCSNCEKWRLVPSKERYEEIREKMEEQHFSCETAREWRPELSCEDEPDIEQDEHLGWAIDRPCIPQTPPGWQRLIRIRAEGGTKFANVYYVSPSNKSLRSMAEINRYLDEHPEYLEDGVNNSRFSFQAPAPLDRNYVSKRRVHAASSSELQIIPVEANPVSSVAPYENVDSRSGEPDIISTEVRSPAES